MVADPFATLRPHLLAAVNDAIAGLEFSHSQLLGQRVGLLNASEGSRSFLPGLLCAFIAETLGVKQEVALKPASALSLLEAVAHVVDDLVVAARDAGEEPRGLIPSWGVPRTLNAADAFFALAHDSLRGLEDDGFSPSRILELLDELNDACRLWAEEASARLAAGLSAAQFPSDALLNAATRLAALAAGQPIDGIDLESFIRLDPTGSTRLHDAERYLAGVPRT